MIGGKELQSMKPTAVLINTARGKVVDERALRLALKEKCIAGYAADVLTGETRFDQDCSDDPLVMYSKPKENVLLTPHIGGRTYEARMKTDIYIAKQLRSAMKTTTKAS
jgi:phosphoglycerate dehydrogenase-like enzyme